MAYTQVDYGEHTYEDFDRFGYRQSCSVFGVNGEQSELFTVIPVRRNSVVTRLGLRLYGWHYSRANGSSRYCMDIHERPLEIRRYSDGRIKLFLDGAPVYTENIKVITRHGVKHRQMEKWYDPTIQAEEDVAAREVRHDQVRQQLKGATGMTYVKLSKGQLEAKYRMALSRLQLASDELEYLEQGGYGRTLHFALAKLSEAFYDVQANRDHDAEKYGFTPTQGVGPGDWKDKQ